MKYPKFLIVIITFVIAYLIFYERTLPTVQTAVISLGYMGTFIAGVFYSYGFSGAIATAIFLVMAKHQSIILAAIVGGGGALIGDLYIFRLLRTSLHDEVNKLSKEKIIKSINKNLPKTLKKYSLMFIACIIIASPLPDEIGVSLLATTKISRKMLIIISLLLNTIGIYIILLIGKAI